MRASFISGSEVFGFGVSVRSASELGRDIHVGGRGEIDVAACPEPHLGRVACLARVRIDARARASRPAVTSAVGALPGGLGDGGAYSPAYLQSAYNAPSATRGGGQTVAIVDAFDDPHAESDLAVYRAHYGLPPCTTSGGCFRKVDQSGGSSYPMPVLGWALEISLDLDMVSALCPNCHILLVEANDNTAESMVAAEDTAVALGATVVSNSWGAGEDRRQLGFDAHFRHQGTAITVASGDFGYAFGPSWPASLPEVSAVGGTALQQATSNGTRDATETAWDGAGSGCSIFEPKPSWQQDACPRRASADVSAVADPATPVWVFDTYTYGLLPNWVQLGGTSVAAPIVAAMYALAAGPAGPEYLPAGYPYAQPGAFNDVTSGSTAECGSYLCTAGPGYDGPTGFGTPDGIRGFQPSLPSAPRDVTSGARAGAVVVSWREPAVNGGAQIGSYRIYRADQSGPVATLGASARAFDDVGLADGRTYSYQVVAVNALGESPAGSAVGTPRPIDHLTLSPSSALMAAGDSQAFRVKGFDSQGNSLGDETAAAALSLGPDGSCTEARCTATIAGEHTVAASVGGATATATLRVSPGPLERIVVSPSKATMPPAASRTFSAEGKDKYGNSLGDKTANVLFSIAPDGACDGPTCTARAAGRHLVTAALRSTDISVGWDGHNCAATTVGLRCWGVNGYGQLGDGTFEDSLAPIGVPGLTSDAAAVAAPFLSTCALRTTGGLSCWGFNLWGRLGNAAATSSPVPVDVVGLTSGVSAISASRHTCAVTTGTGLKCWGFNALGQVGDGTDTDRWAPADVAGLTSGVVGVSTGGFHTCAVTTAGGAKCWGNNWDGELGNGTFGAGDCDCLFRTPGDVSGLTSGVSAVSAGLEHTCALTTAGGVKCWGDNTYGELGHGTTDTAAFPVDVVGLPSGVTAVSAGVDLTCAITVAGGVKCWGHGPQDESGFGPIIKTPEDVSQLDHGVTALSVGSQSVCALRAPAGVTCWQAGATASAVPLDIPLASVTTAVLRVGRCVVPQVTGKALKVARRAIRKAHCRVGSIRLRYSARVRTGRVISQRPRPRTRLALDSRVSLVVSRGHQPTLEPHLSRKGRTT